MPLNKTYRTWIQRICKVTAPCSRELRPKQRKTQVQNLVWLMVGIYHSHSVNLSKIASQVISTAKNVSTIRRLSRFLESSAVDVRSWYRSTAKAWLGAQAQQVGEIRLIVDSNKIGFGYQLLMAVWRIDNEPFQLPGHGFTMFVGTAVLRNRSSC